MKTIIKMDDINRFFIIHKDSDPISAFYELLVVESNSELAVLAGSRPDVIKILVNRDQYDSEVLGRIMPKYAKKKMPYASDKQRQMAVSMLDLDIGPVSSDEVPAGEVWLMTGWLREEE